MSDSLRVPTDPRTVDIGEMTLPPRAFNCLRNADIVTLADLLGQTDELLLRLPMFGPSSLAAVHAALAEFGLSIPRRLARPAAAAPASPSPADHAEAPP